MTVSWKNFDDTNDSGPTADQHRENKRYMRRNIQVYGYHISTWGGVVKSLIVCASKRFELG